MGWQAARQPPPRRSPKHLARVAAVPRRAARWPNSSRYSAMSPRRRRRRLRTRSSRWYTIAAASRPIRRPLLILLHSSPWTMRFSRSWQVRLRPGPESGRRFDVGWDKPRRAGTQAHQRCGLLVPPYHFGLWTLDIGLAKPQRIEAPPIAARIGLFAGPLLALVVFFLLPQGDGG